MKNWSENIDFNRIIDIILESNSDSKFISAEVVGELNGEPVWEINFEQYNDHVGDVVICSRFINAYGFVNVRKDDSFYQIFPEKNTETLKPLVKYIATVNKGVEINGKTYLEAFKSLFKKEKTQMYDKEISKTQERMTSLINKKITLLQNINKFAEEIDSENTTQNDNNFVEPQQENGVAK